MTEAAEAAPAAKPLAFTIEADGSRLRKLVKPIEAPNGTLTAIKIRQPTYNEIMTIGDPAALILMDRSALPYEDMSIVRQYVSALALTAAGDKVDPTALTQCDYRDAIALKDMILSFFR